MEQSKLTQQQLLTLTDKISTLDLVIANLREQLDVKQSIILKKDEQIATYSELSSKLEKELKRERATKKLYKIGSTVGLAAVLLNILGK